MSLYNKAEQTYIIFCEEGNLLDKLSSTKLQHTVRFLYCVEKEGKGDTYSSRSGSKKKLKERMAEVQPVWTNYFEDAAAAGGEDDARGSGDASL